MNQSVHVDTRTNRFVVPPRRLQRDPNKASLNKVLAQKFPYVITHMVGNFHYVFAVVCVARAPQSSTDNLSSSNATRLAAFFAIVDISSLDARRN